MADLDEEHEDIFGLEMSSFVDGIQKRLIRLPKTKQKAVLKTEDSLRKNLSKDTSIDIAALVSILKDLLKK
jgi:hypothetical protein